MAYWRVPVPVTGGGPVAKSSPHGPPRCAAAACVLAGLDEERVVGGVHQRNCRVFTDPQQTSLRGLSDPFEDLWGSAFRPPCSAFRPLIKTGLSDPQIRLV